MTLSEKLHLGQSKAPSYCIVEADGIPYTCPDCGEECETMVKCFTPDGKSHKPCCLSCIDEEWLANATKLRFII